MSFTYETEEEVRYKAELAYYEEKRPTVLKFVVLPCFLAIIVGILVTFSSRELAGRGLLIVLVAVGWMFASGFFLPVTSPTKPALTRSKTAGPDIHALSAPVTANGVPIGHARMPTRAEPLHTLIEGATGTGKTQILKRLVRYVRERGDSVVVVDSNYDLHGTLGRPGDVVLSPFDPASPGWLPRNEVRDPSDWSALAQSFIGDGAGEAKQWHSMAKAMFAAVAARYERMVRDAGEPFDHGELFHLLTAASGEDLAPFVQGTAAASLASNDKGLGAVRMTYFDTLRFWEHLREGDFSLRDWVNQDQRPSLFIPYRRRQLETTRTLVSAWLDQIIQGAIDRGESDQRTWLIIDELGGIGQIAGLKVAATQLRKTGIRIVAGIQDVPQFEALYGRQEAASIVNSLSNKVMLRPNDQEMAERMSRMIGDARFQITSRSKTKSTSPSGDSEGSTVSSSEKVERAVLPSQLMGLPDLQALVRWAGDTDWQHTAVPIFDPLEPLRT